ncbi:HCP-like protein [Gonapodya prolifera JEL478]|uniref:HCP-like protein n=1 Tax=Gonapodya prolifera (strain JEL478) TaxID=1344416 RepID=A0A139A7V6_GONPJ|nr:HCP-like protein [Gonapodya prolifera JEL478]|eukprot:KXS12891.1 HCP-like protein [Gonapodya prolifera JEL478]
MPMNVAALMQRCWADDPSKRPSFEEIVGMLEEIWPDLPHVRPVPTNDDLLTLVGCDFPAEAEISFEQAQKFRKDGDLTMALRNYMRGAEVDHLEAQYQCAEWCKIGLGLHHRDLHKAAYWYEKAAKQGHAPSLCALGDFHRFGLGPCSRDMVRATELYRKAAGLDHVDAQTRLGFMLMHQYEVRWDYDEAVRCWKRAAEKKSALAKFLLAECHLLGLGMRQDIIEGENLAKAAAELGNPDAQFHMGIICETCKDFTSARDWYERASKQGHAGAKTHLGDLHWHGVGGLTSSKEKAVKWYREATEQGNIGAIWRLGYCYREGQGIEKDMKRGKALTQSIGKSTYVIPDRLKNVEALGFGGTPAVSHVPAPIRKAFEGLQRGTRAEFQVQNAYVPPDAIRAIAARKAKSMHLESKHQHQWEENLGAFRKEH